MYLIALRMHSLTDSWTLGSTLMGRLNDGPTKALQYVSIFQSGDINYGV